MLKKHTNPITANLSSPWPPHGSLARQDEAIDNLLADLDMAKPIKTDVLAQQSACQVA